MAVFLARIVIPRSFSWSLESITRSESSSLRSRVPDARKRASTNVVLPWSTWAIMAILRKFSITSLSQIKYVGCTHNASVRIKVLGNYQSGGRNCCGIATQLHKQTDKVYLIMRDCLHAAAALSQDDTRAHLHNLHAVSDQHVICSLYLDRNTVDIGD